MSRNLNSYRKRKKTKNGSFSWKKIFVFLTFLSLGVVGVAFVLFVFVFLYRWILFHPVWQLREITVKGNSRITYNQVIEQTNLKLYQSTLEIQIAEVQQSLEQLDWVQEVVVKRILPDKIEIIIKEKEAFFWKQEGSFLYYSDKKGNPIYRVEKEPFVSLPVLYVENESSKDIAAQLVELVHFRTFPLGWHEIAWVRVLATDMVEVVLLNGTKCLLETEQLDKASSQLAQTWRYIQSKETRHAAKKIIVIPDRVWVEFTG